MLLPKSVRAEDVAAVADAGDPTSDVGGAFPVNFVWTIVAAILVFWMQAGFALVEAGLTRAKNTVNIMMKNLMDFAVGSLAFWAVGFALMFGVSNGLFGKSGFFLSGMDQPWDYAFLLFQTVFAATAATIVSGAMAERTKFSSYLIYSFVISAFIYPVFGSWAWGGLYHGGGWLEAGEGSLLASWHLPGFIDFAGSTVVHSIGGWAALAGALVLGPRLGKYDKQGRARPLRGHNMAFATLGVFILWMGWFGFNAGSTTGATGGGDSLYGGAGKAFALIAVNTNLAACAGAVVAMFFIWVRTKKPDIGMTLNGVLAGLVAITSPCATVTPLSAIMIGGIAGGLVIVACAFFEKVKVDDPVGAVSVHGVCGAWGTLSAGIFNVNGFSWAQLGTQAIGVTAAFVWSFGLCYILFRVLKATIGLRVSAEEETEGLDLSEHGSECYPGDNSVAGHAAAAEELPTAATHHAAALEPAGAAG
ncbi:MAG: ammonium transporter [Kofleriaceae bacterium]|nr:ammonium transporter [Myxococcales bacterium]MCB9559340.1 ammonium transporter [Kofleriaceae bacterium]MCB9574024.1 ammonium transporter [Kofleriaceae bacterium]